jgi:hypothetical protein
MIVDHRRQQIIGGPDGVKIASKVQIDLFHRHHLRIATASGAAFHAKTWAKGWLAQAHHGLLADLVETVAKTDQCGGFAFSGGGR